MCQVVLILLWVHSGVRLRHPKMGTALFQDGTRLRQYNKILPRFFVLYSFKFYVSDIVLVFSNIVHCTFIMNILK